MAVPLSALAGLLGIVLGIVAFRALARHLQDVDVVAGWKHARAVALLVGVVLAAGSWLGREWLSYAGEGPQGPGTVIGWPFFVAFRDAQGSGGVSFLTLPLAILNAAFWFLVPQLLLWILPWRRRRQNAGPTAGEER